MPESKDERRVVGFPTEPVSMEMTFHEVNPELLGILTGGVMGTPPSPTFSMTINTPVKRTFWQWLRRKPKRWTQTYLPNVRLSTEEDDA